MRTIQVASLPLDEVISDIAHEFKTEPQMNFHEHFLELPERIGTGKISGSNFDGGLGIIQYNCTFNEDTEIQFIVNKVHPLKFLYVLTGNINHRFENDPKTHVLHKFQNAIVSSNDRNGHILNFKKDVHTTIYSLEIDRKRFNEKSAYRHDGMDATLKKLFQDIDARDSFYYEGDYSLKMADLFKNIEDFDGSGFLYMIFMESIAYQTLVQQISQYLDDQKQEKNRNVLRRNERDGIARAADYIHNNLATYKSMAQLTDLTGLNASKLQEGFKNLYHKTVNQYVFDARLELAKDLLIKTDDTMSEIVYKLGLSSKSYFSRIFKEEYGVQPSTFRKEKK